MYQYLEPLYNDYRKVRLREADGSFALTHMDEVVDQLLNNEYLFDIALPRIPNRSKPCSWQAVIEGPMPVTDTQPLTLRQRIMVGQWKMCENQSLVCWELTTERAAGWDTSAV